MSFRHNTALNTSARRNRRKAAKLAKRNGEAMASAHHGKNAARALLAKALHLRMENTAR